jgi:AcrR family transcriptional regulator
MSNNSVPAPRRRQDVATRRRQLLQIGCELFASQPYDEVWIDDVARSAGTSRGLLYHYFGNKRQFLMAVVAHEAAQLLVVTEPDPTLPPPQRLRHSLDRYLDYVVKHPHGYRTLYQGGATTDSGVRAIMTGHLDRQRQRVLTDLIGNGPAPDLLRAAVHGWLAFVVATCLDWLDNPTLDRTTLRDLCIRALSGVITAAGHQPHE